MDWKNKNIRKGKLCIVQHTRFMAFLMSLCLLLFSPALPVSASGMPVSSGDSVSSGNAVSSGDAFPGFSIQDLVFGTFESMLSVPLAEGSEVLPASEYFPSSTNSVSVTLPTGDESWFGADGLRFKLKKPVEIPEGKLLDLSFTATINRTDLYPSIVTFDMSHADLYPGIIHMYPSPTTSYRWNFSTTLDTSVSGKTPEILFGLSGRRQNAGYAGVGYSFSLNISNASLSLRDDPDYVPPSPSPSPDPSPTPDPPYIPDVIPGEVDGDIRAVFNQTNMTAFLFHNASRFSDTGTEMLPYIYEGSISNTISLSMRSGYEDARYADGTAYFPVTFQGTEYPTGTFAHMLTQVSISDISAPEGITLSLEPVSSGETSAVYNLAINFDKFEFTGTEKIIGFTLNLQTALGLPSSSVSPQTGRCVYSVSAASDYAGDIRYFESLSSIDQGHRELIENQNTVVNVLIKNDNANAQTIVNNQNILHEQQIANDNSNHQQQIANDNANTEKLANGYDNSSGLADKDRLSSSLGNLASVEDSATENAIGTVSSFSFDGFMDFTVELTSALTFVSSMVDAFLFAGNQFEILPVLIYTLAFLVIVVGIWRFVRGSVK